MLVAPTSLVPMGSVYFSLHLSQDTNAFIYMSEVDYRSTGLQKYCPQYVHNSLHPHPSVVHTLFDSGLSCGTWFGKRVEDRCLIKIRIWWKWDSQPPFLALLQAIILSEYIPDRKLVDSYLGKLPRRTELQILTFVSFKMKQQGPCLTTPQ